MNVLTQDVLEAWKKAAEGDSSLWFRGAAKFYASSLVLRPRAFGTLRSVSQYVELVTYSTIPII